MSSASLVFCYRWLLRSCAGVLCEGLSGREFVVPKPETLSPEGFPSAAPLRWMGQELASASISTVGFQVGVFGVVV